MIPATKSSIKAAYISELQKTYPFYVEGSRPLDLANAAADAALSGKARLDGASWDEALKIHGLSFRTTLKTLAALPD